MRINISAWSIRKPIPALVLFTVLMVIGTIAFRNLPITRFPNIDVPIVTVLVTQPGAAPAELETQVTKKVEDSIAGITGVKHITSTITDSTSQTVVEFLLETNTDRAVNDVKDAVSKIRSDLPATINEPIVQRLVIEGAAILTFAVSNPVRNSEEISWYIDDVVTRKLQGVRGVASVSRVGGVTREIRVSLDPDKMNALGVTSADVNKQLHATNVDVAGGRGEVGGSEQAIRTLAGAHSMEDLANTVIALPGNRNVKLSELGTVTDMFEEPRIFARLDGKPVVGFGVFRSKGESDARVSDLAKAKVAELVRENPEFKIDLIDTSVDYTVGNYNSAMEGLLEGAFLSVLVVFLFLRDWRATLISAVALPLSAIPTFWAMSQLGFSLNLVSLLGITLATGVLVDDAIVEIENIVRHMHMGKSAYNASLEAADEIGLAVVAISLTIMAVFAPVSFMGGIAGQYFKQFGLTVAIAVFFSLLTARLITPMLTAYFLKSHDEPRHVGDGWIMRSYTGVVRFSVHHRWFTLLVGLGLFALSIWSTGFLEKGFIPAGDEARLLFAAELPPGSRLTDTQAVADDITARLKKMPEVESVFVNGGYVISGGNEIRKATLTIRLVHKTKRKKSQKDMENEIGHLLAETPDLRFWGIQGNGQRGLSLIIAGNNNARIADVAAQMQSQMKTIPSYIANPVSTAPLDRPEIHVVPKPGLAADLGVSTDTISQTIRIATIGDVSSNLAKYTIGDRQIPIRVQLLEKARTDMGVLENLKVGTGRGGTVPLSTVADVEFSQGPTSIGRYDRSRRVAVEADLVGNTPLGSALDKVNQLPVVQKITEVNADRKKRNLPPEIEIKQTGDAEVQGEVFAGFATAMGAGLMMVFGVLVLLFASVLQPITILFSLPLSIGGVVLALLITGKALSMPVVIGILMLIGIVTKNAIMLVDFAIEEMAKGVGRTEAIVDAGRKRARPIVMTTIAMGAGMFPSALALGDGGEFRAPMAIGVIGGLIVSTVLSLVFVPAVFTIMDSVGNGIWWVFGRFIGPTDVPTRLEHVSQPMLAKPPLANAAE